LGYESEKPEGEEKAVCRHPQARLSHRQRHIQRHGRDSKSIDIELQNVWADLRVFVLEPKNM
jgi:hypothetical protein